MEKKWTSYLQIFLLVSSIFAFSFLASFPVYAQEPDYCCAETKEGFTCLDLSFEDCEQNCKEDCLPTSCDLTSVCKLGCCYDSSEGLCTPNSPKQKCEQEGGIWKDDKACNILECRT